MPRQSITITRPNSEWLKAKVTLEGEYSSNSELVNELIRKARSDEKTEIDKIRAALEVGEQSGISNLSIDEIWEKARSSKG